MAAGSVRTQANSRLRTVAHCRPEPLAAMVPATPDDNTWVVETGSPYTSAAAIVPAATVDELEPERDQERDEQQQEWQIRRRLHPGVFDVHVEAIGRVKNAGGQDSEEQDQRQGIRGRLEIRFRTGEVGTVQWGGDIGHGVLGVGAGDARA
jgi:hypothetical protein